MLNKMNTYQQLVNVPFQKTYLFSLSLSLSLLSDALIACTLQRKTAGWLKNWITFERNRYWFN
jgi:hypothetical protein